MTKSVGVCAEGCSSPVIVLRGNGAVSHSQNVQGCTFPKLLRVGVQGGTLAGRNRAAHTGTPLRCAQFVQEGGGIVMNECEK
jgi:hypothetical protein